MTLTLTRVSCRHCGEPKKPRGLAAHERACPRNPAPLVRVGLGIAPEPPAPAPEPTFPCPHPGCGYVARTRDGLAIHDVRRHRVAPEPVPILAPDVPAETDEPPPRRRIALHATITCTNCGREGTPSATQPEHCKACASSPDSAAWRATQLWRCACDGPFVRSTTDPARCIRCTGEYDQVTRRQRS